MLTIGKLLIPAGIQAVALPEKVKLRIEESIHPVEMASSSLHHR